MTTTRRAFLGGLSGTVLTAGLGARLGFAWPLEEDTALHFGELEPLVALMQETAPERLQAILVDRINDGARLETLVSAAALANARTFGGHDYTGYHCMMALMPAVAMAKELPERLRPLPVLKVLYRNSARIQETGGRSKEALRALPRAPHADRDDGVRQLREALYARDVEAAERAFAGLSHGAPEDAYNDLQSILRENLDVHRVVLAWRAWEVMGLTGERHASTLLRQSVRFCVDAEKNRVDRGRPEPKLRSLLPELMEQHRLAEKPAGKRRASAKEMDELWRVIFCCSKESAAEAIAERLGEGLSHEDVGEAMSLAANALLLHDPGRQREQPGKPVGSVHGASVGVHASDAARAWREIATVSNHENAVAGLIAGAYHTAGQTEHVGSKPYAYKDLLDEVGRGDADELLRRMRAAVEDGDQRRACAVAHGYDELGHPVRRMFDLLLEYAVSEDGALHAEKYYRTVRTEYDAARPTYRRGHLVALARVTASEHGFPAPGLAAARERLKV